MQISADDPNVETAIFGSQVQHFMESDVGVYLMQKADDYAQDAIDKLTRVDPEDPPAIRRLQNQIAVADLIAAWLKEAMAMGKQSEVHLSELVRS